MAASMVDAEFAYVHPKPEGDPHGCAVAEAGLRARPRACLARA